MDMKKTRKTGLLIAGWMLVGLLQASPQIGLVVGLQGAAEATGADGADRTLALQGPVFLNDTVRTGTGAKLQIMLDDDTLLAQGEQSEMTIDEYLYNPEDRKKNGFAVKLGQGAFRTITGRITEMNPDRFQVRTSRANIGIRGCELMFLIDARQDQILVSSVPEGKEIVIDPFQGDQFAALGAPAFVSVDDQGVLTQRELTAEDRAAARDASTPAPPPAVAPADDAPSAELTSTTVEGPESDLTQTLVEQADAAMIEPTTGSVLDDDRAVQESNQPAAESHDPHYPHP